MYILWSPLDADTFYCKTMLNWTHIDHEIHAWILYLSKMLQGVYQQDNIQGVYKQAVELTTTSSPKSTNWMSWLHLIDPVRLYMPMHRENSSNNHKMNTSCQLGAFIYLFICTIYSKGWEIRSVQAGRSNMCSQLESIYTVCHDGLFVNVWAS